jgi:AcrR family transcriptional regulator
VTSLNGALIEVDPRIERTTCRLQSPCRRQDPGASATQTRNEILDVATKEFADQGYSGARVDHIAAQTRTTKRMIYYYFGSKEQLYICVLNQAYGAIRAAEQQIDVEHLDPVTAIRR